MQENNKSVKAVEAIKKHNMIFISAQPDTVYFHWQVALYMYQFSKHNIIDRCYALFGYTGNKPSKFVTDLAKKYPTVKFYKDTRIDKEYVPTIRPHILSKFFESYPHLGKNVFYHDSDIFLVKMPQFNLMLGDDIGYLSDTLSYIGYDYIKTCGDRYKEKYNNLPDNDIFKKMCKIMDIDPELVKKNQNNSGGAQYLLKNIDSKYWKSYSQQACSPGPTAY